MRSLPCQALSKETKERFPAQDQRQLQITRVRQGMKHPALSDGSVRLMAGLGELEFFSSVNDSMIP